MIRTAPPRPRRSLLTIAAALIAAATLAPRAAAAQGRIVVNADEWTFSNGNIDASPNDGSLFATNVRNWLTGGVPGNILAYSTNFGLTGSTLASVMNSGGYTWTVVTPGTPAAATAWASRNSYDAIYLGGDLVLSITDLVNYVNAGGSIYLMGGTGSFGGEDTYWDVLLGRFGLDFGTSYNGIGGNIATTGFDAQGPFGAALFSGVTNLHQNNGNNVLNAVALPGDVTRQVFTVNGAGLFGAAAIAQSTVPEPSTYLLFGTGLLALGAVARRSRR